MAGYAELTPNMILRKRIDYGGLYQITGNVDRLGVDGIYKICLFDRENKLPVAFTFSDEDGNYTFPYIKYIANGYYAIAFDNENVSPLNAAIADLITPVLMP